MVEFLIFEMPKSEHINICVINAERVFFKFIENGHRGK